MGAFLPFILLAAATAPGSGSLSAPAFTATTGAKASARATVRIVAGTRVRLGESANVDTYLVSNSTVRDETGTIRPAKLVEFQ